MSNTQQTIPNILERYELKFVIPFELIGPISDFVSIYCTLDKYSQNSDNSFYKVNNLYFDTPYFLFLRNRINRVEKRFNMRVRSYGDNSELPYFLEIKQKRGDIVKKSRGRLYERDWFNIFKIPDFLEKVDAESQEKNNLHLFQKTALTYNAEPKVLTQYIRKAYISDYEEYARVTFDIDLRYMQEERFNLIPDNDRMLSYDFSTNFDPDCNVILELKCYTSYVPLWMVDLIRTFNLQRRGFSKYTTGVLEVINSFSLNLSDMQSTSSLI